MIPATINVFKNHRGLKVVISFVLICILYRRFLSLPPSKVRNYTVQTHISQHISHLRLSLLLFSSMVALRRAPPHPCQRIFLLGCPVPIRQGACPFKTPREHETEPGRDVSWLPHLPVSGMVKLLSWGVTLGVLCVLLERVCIRTHV